MIISNYWSVNENNLANNLGKSRIILIFVPSIGPNFVGAIIMYRWLRLVWWSFYMELQELIGQAIVNRRKSMGISQEELAKRSGVCRRYIVDIETELARYQLVS